MSRTTRAALGILGAGALLGVFADVLFYGRPLGVNVLLWTFAFVLALAALLFASGAPFHQGRHWMIAPLVAFSAAFLWRDSQLLVATNLLALAGAMTLGALRRNGARPQSAPLAEYAAGAVAAGFSAAAGAVRLIHRDVEWEDVGRSVRGERLTIVARGIGLGLPLVILFGGLFVAADAVFQDLVSNVVPAIDSVPQHLLFVSVAAWLTAGLLRDLVATREQERLISPADLSARRVHFWLGPGEVSIALAGLNALFLAFVAVQFRYLFGGDNVVLASIDLTYAEYARRGFFELVAVAVLVLLVLLATDALVRRSPARSTRLVRILAGVLIALVFVVMASALQRMYLYQDVYGLTQLRIYVTGVILWLAVVFVWFAATILRGHRRRFAVGAVIAGFVASAVLNALNPDALIARTNLERPRIDAVYLTGLSDDAVPVLLERLPTLPPGLRGVVATDLLARAEVDGDWRSFNLSRSHAHALLTEHRDELVAFWR
jgi:hypothetical protein